MSLDRFDLTVAALAGQGWPALPDIPGRLILARDEPIGEEYLVGVTSPSELALLLGISRTQAVARLAKEVQP